jgi:hypothetical protein
MSVSVPIIVIDPPAAPPSYTLCAFEVRTVAAGSDLGRRNDGRYMDPIAVFSGTTDGFEDAANILIKAVQLSLRDVGVGLRLAAVAWWIDRPLDEAVSGRERIVSIYDAAACVWGEWVPEERVGDIAKVSVPNQGRGGPGQATKNRG